MLQTNQYTERFQDSTERKQSSSLVASLDTVQGFENESVFIESLMNQGVDPHDKTTVEYANALSYYAEDFCNVYADTLGSKKSEEISLIANTPYMLQVSKDLAYYENERKVRRLDEDEWAYFTQTLKPYAVWYNQKLSDYLFVNSDTKFSLINDALASGAYDSFPHKEGAVEQQVKNIARGARTEAVSRQLLKYTDIQHAPGTAEDDLRGGDIIIICSAERIKVDLKSSLESIAKLRGGYDEINNSHVAYAIVHNKRDAHGSIVLFPGFTDKDLGDNCRLSDRVAEQRSQLMANQLQRACIELGL